MFFRHLRKPQKHYFTFDKFRYPFQNYEQRAERTHDLVLNFLLVAPNPDKKPVRMLKWAAFDQPLRSDPVSNDGIASVVLSSPYRRLKATQEG